LSTGKSQAGIDSIPVASTTAKTEKMTGDNNALIEALVQKGILSGVEAENIAATMQKQNQSAPGGFLQLGSKAVTGLRLYGDARIRYQWNNASTEGPANQNHDQDRYRLRVRLGVDYQFAENWKAGVRLETGTKSDSANTDFGGFFSKDNMGMNIGLAYLEYESATPSLFNNSIGDYIDFRAGKILQPFFNNDLLFYSEINPEGFAEQIGWKDVGVEGLNLNLRGGEFIISNVNEDSSWVAGQTPSSDQFLFIGQAEARYNFDKNAYVSVAPSFITETDGSAYITANQQDGNAAFDTSQLPQVNGYTYFGRIDVVTLPVEVNWQAFGLPHRVYGSWGYNLSANDRARVYGLRDGGGNQLFNVGYQLGDTKKKGHWQFIAEYRFIEAAAYDSFLTDSNFFSLNYLNQQGFILRAAYAFTDNVWLTAAYNHTNAIDGNATPVKGLTASSTTASSLIKQVDMFQIDLNWKF
jgi:hypothetical protein